MQLHLYYFRLLWWGFRRPETCNESNELLLVAPILSCTNHSPCIVERVLKLTLTDVLPVYMFNRMLAFDKCSTVCSVITHLAHVSGVLYILRIAFLWSKCPQYSDSDSSLLLRILLHKCAHIFGEEFWIIKLRYSTGLPYLLLQINSLGSRHPVSVSDSVYFKKEMGTLTRF